MPTIDAETRRLNRDRTYESVWYVYYPDRSDEAPGQRFKVKVPGGLQPPYVVIIDQNGVLVHVLAGRLPAGDRERMLVGAQLLADGIRGGWWPGGGTEYSAGGLTWKPTGL